jgi:O-antigen/teichoic acid export membrane protein
MDKSQPPHTRLRDRALKAGVWTLGAYGFDLALRLISNLILTRLLFPEAFAVVAAATALIVGLSLVSDFGLRAVIIQSPRGDHDAFLRSAWTFQVWRGIAIWVTLVILCALMDAPAVRNMVPIDSVFANKSFPLVTAVLGVIVVLGGAESTAVILNIRRLNFRPVVLLDVAGRMLPLPIMFVWAWMSPTVWSLIGGAIAGSILRVVLSHIMIPGPGMALNYDADHVQEIVRFGKWITVSSSATFISQQSDIILLGVLLPSSTLGVYFISKLLVNTGEGLLERLNSSLALPVLGEILRKDRCSLRNRYYRFRLPIDLAAGVLSGVLCVAASLIVNVLYDARYSGAGPMLEILAVGLALYPLLIIRSAFTATGDVRTVAIVSIVQAVSLVFCIVIGFMAFSSLGAVIGIAIHRLFPSALIIFLAHRRSWVSAWHEFRIIPFFIVGCVIGFAALVIARALGICNLDVCGAEFGLNK